MSFICSETGQGVDTPAPLRYINPMETPDPHKLARELAVLEERMQAIRTEYQSGFDRISAQIKAEAAKREAEAAKREAEAAKLEAKLESERKAEAAKRKADKAEHKAELRQIETNMARRDRAMLIAMSTLIIGGFVMLGFFLRYTPILVP